MENPTFSSVRTFVHYLGRSEFQRRLGHCPQVVTRAFGTNQMPAHWAFAIRAWCEEIGIDNPEHLYRQTFQPRNMAVTQDENSRPSCQERAAG